MAENTWQPIVVDGPRADAVHDALRAIARDLRPEPLLATGWRSSPGLPGGCAGLALLYGYLARTDFEPSMISVCEEWIERAINGLAEVPLTAALHGGFTGVAWTNEHLGNLFPDEDAEDGDAEDGDAEDDEEDFDANEEIEDTLLQMVRRTPWSGPYDLISGLAGFGVFCLERGDKPGSRECLREIIDRLEELATIRDDEVTWHTPPEELVEWQREREPEGYYNLGVAHGIPALMGLLSAVVQRDVNAAKARRLLEGAQRWLWRQALPSSEGSIFPSWISSVHEPSSGRLAWCYGDPGIAATLLAGQRLLGQEDTRVLDLAKQAAACRREDSGVVDCGLCHGAAGLVHIFNRLYQSTRLDLFRQAALNWLDITLEMRDPELGAGAGGFWSRESRFPSMETECVALPNFLTGSAGVALALLATTSDLEPGWDRALMMSL